MNANTTPQMLADDVARNFQTGLAAHLLAKSRERPDVTITIISGATLKEFLQGEAPQETP